MKTDLFQSCDYCWVFQICWHIEWSTFTASSFKIWNTLAGIPSPPLTLFIVMPSKDHLILHFRMSGYRWVTTPSWLSGSLRPFCSVLLCILATSFKYLLLLLGSHHFCPLLCPSMQKCSLGNWNYLALFYRWEHHMTAKSSVRISSWRGLVFKSERILKGKLSLGGILSTWLYCRVLATFQFFFVN